MTTIKITLPTKQLDNIFHVGTLDLSNKRDRNYEGNNGLSVTTEPNAWRRINRGQTFGNTNELSKSDGLFIDAHNIDDKTREKLFEWGVLKGYLVHATKYTVTYFDDEMDCDLQSQFSTLADAQEEAESYEVEPETKSTFSPTEKMLKIIGKENDDISLIIGIYAQLHTKTDGVFWDDNLDVIRYSAPRGILFQSKLNEWSHSIVQDKYCAREQKIESKTPTKCSPKTP
jgi:hypothetical protein